MRRDSYFNYLCFCIKLEMCSLSIFRKEDNSFPNNLFRVFQWEKKFIIKPLPETCLFFVLDFGPWKSAIMW